MSKVYKRLAENLYLKLTISGNAAQITSANDRINYNVATLQALDGNFKAYVNSQIKFQVESQVTGEVLSISNAEN